MKPSFRIGVLAEDQTDCSAIAELIKRIAYAAAGITPGIKTYSSKGCARLRRKAERHLMLMVDEGCRAAVLVHDLDRNSANDQLNDERALRRDLAAIETPSEIAGRFLICIPIEEIEAWFWSDEATVQKATKGNPKAKAHHSPHRIAKPKEQFERLSRHKTGRTQYDSNENVELAKILDLRTCANRCPSFQQLCAFVETLVRVN